jgi:hypothetical protein
MPILSGKFLLSYISQTFHSHHVPVEVYGVKMILRFCHDPLIQEEAFSGAEKLNELSLCVAIN